MSEKILSVKNLSVTLDDNDILEGISFDIAKHDALAVIGPNGSGKTILLKALLGSVSYQGEIQWAKDIRWGYVPQKIEADRHLPLNLANLLEAKREILKLASDSMRSIVRDVGITPQALRTPVGHLSGGQFQKALIAFALLGKPNVLILDEPTASIDEPREHEIYELVHNLQDQYSLTVILVSHDLSVVYRYATKVLCLNRRNLCFGSPREVLTPANLEKIYGAPHKYHYHNDYA